MLVLLSLIVTIKFLWDGDTLRGEHKLETFAESVGVEIKSYRADNQIFNSEEYLEDYET